ncbi:MAG: hypothetical protein ACOH1T_12340 [Microbacteriaceae bacterium]
MSITDGSYTVGFTLSDARDTGVESNHPSEWLEGTSEVSYPDVFENVDLEYLVRPDSLKETLVLSSLPLEQSAEWTWTISAPGLLLTKTNVGSLEFRDAKNVVRFSIPTPVMWDSSGIDGQREASELEVETVVEEVSAGTYRFSLIPDYGWLSAPERKYPVYVDPTTILGDSNLIAYKSDGATRTDYVHLGNSRDSNSNRFWRTQVKYNYASLFGKQILDAQITASYVSGSNAAFTGSVNTATCAGYACVGSKLADLPVGTSGVTPASNVALPAKISAWVSGNQTGKALLFRGAETSSYTYKAVNTTLKVAWKAFPSVTARIEPSPANAASSGRTPILNVQTSDPGGNGVVVKYLISETSDFSAPTFISDWISPGEFEIPEGVLAADQQYFWKAIVKDGYDGLFGVSTERSSAVWNFTTVNHAPEMPVIGGFHPATSQDGKITTSAHPRFAATGFDDDDDAISVAFEVVTLDGAGSPSGVVETCDSNLNSAETVHSCAASSQFLEEVSYGVRARATDGIATGPWSPVTPFEVSSSILDPTESGPTALDFEHPISLVDASELVSGLGVEPFAYHFESDDVVGEWSPEEGETVASFLSEYAATYGSVPEVTGVLFEPAQLASIDSNALTNPATPDEDAQIITPAPQISSPAATGGGVAQFDSAIEEAIAEEDAQFSAGNVAQQNTWGSFAQAQSGASAPTKWIPATSSTNVRKSAVGSKKYVTIDSHYYWDGKKSDPKKIDPDFGVEFETVFTGSHYDSSAGLRCRTWEFCISPFNACHGDVPGEWPVAKQKGWTWSVYVKKDRSGSSADNVKLLGAYADTWDLWNRCNDNSVSIGLRYPHKIPAITGTTMKKLWIHIRAPKGIENSSRVSGSIQAIEGESCDFNRRFNKSYPYTKCMGADITIPFKGPGLVYAITLNAKRKAIGPNHCWKSTDYGTSYTKITYCPGSW